jgi:hypothetical protein
MTVAIAAASVTTISSNWLRDYRCYDWYCDHNYGYCYCHCCKYHFIHCVHLLSPKERFLHCFVVTHDGTLQHGIEQAGSIIDSINVDSQPAQLDPRRIDRPDVQSLLRKVEPRPDDSFTARYPGEVPSRVTVRLKGGKSYSHEVKDYPGFPTRPFTWEEIGAKFEKLAGDRAEQGLRKDIKVASLESIQGEGIDETARTGPGHLLRKGV